MDAFGLRAVFSVLLPASNTVVEPDMAALRPAGVTNQSYRFPFPGLPNTVEDLIDLMRPTLDLALACEPDRIVVAYTPEYMAESVTASRRLPCLHRGRDRPSGDDGFGRGGHGAEYPWRAEDRARHTFSTGGQPQS